MIFHNLSGNESHPFFKEIVARKDPKVQLKVIPKTNEKITSIKYGCLKFIESM